mmetsp:Transcript_21159/g.39775  ORF Transcript_21159/g.39775 Transcript_21159/m.39775 type:complete len:101 (-) Transcript_21159:30-332(-)
MALERFLRRVQKQLQPTSWDKKALNRLSWGITIVVLAKWLWDDEQTNPKWFQEAPTLFGNPQARQLPDEDYDKWNASIAPKDQQLVWKPDTSADDRFRRK